MTIKNTTSIKATSHHKWYSKANGCSLAGYLDMPYYRLVEAFGEPTIKTDGYKTDAEWHVSFHDSNGDDVGFVTIYNFKDGKNYCGADGLNVSDMTHWHVGSKNKASYWILEDYLK